VDAEALTLLFVKATLLLLAGALAAAALRRSAAGVRHLVWLVTLSSVLVLPVLVQVAPLRLAVLPRGLVPGADLASIRDDQATAAANGARPATGAVPAPAARVSRTVAAETRAESTPRGVPWPSPRWALVALWAAVAAAIALRLLLGGLAARRIVRSARPLDDPRWTRLMRDIADRLDLPEVPPLLASDRVEMPFACGAWRSAVVLPAHAEGWSEERRQVVLLHELAHVKRRDLVAHGLGRLACALYWFHPLVWSADRRLRAEGERACDDLVLACGARASDYASHLLDILTAARNPGAPATALPMARSREFEGRLLAILDPIRQRRAPGRAQSAALLAALAGVFVAVAAAAPAPPAARDSSPAVPAAPREGEPTPAPRTIAAASQKPEPAKVVVERKTEHEHESKVERKTEAESEARSESEREGAEAETDEAPATATEIDADSRALVLRALRSDADPTVRRSAAWALADRTRPDEIGVLIATLRGDADAGVREMAAWALSDVRNQDATAALAYALQRDGDAHVRATAAWALGQRRLRDVAPLTAALKDASAEVQRAAIWALGHQRLESAPAELTAALRASESEVRLHAAWALGQILDPGTAPALRAAFIKEEDGEARRAIFRALAFLGDRSPEFLDRAAKSKDTEVRSRAVLMLGGQGPGIWPWPWPWPQPRPNP